MNKENKHRLLQIRILTDTEHYEKIQEKRGDYLFVINEENKLELFIEKHNVDYHNLEAHFQQVIDEVNKDVLFWLKFILEKPNMKTHIDGTYFFDNKLYKIHSNEEAAEISSQIETEINYPDGISGKGGISLGGSGTLSTGLPSRILKFNCAHKENRKYLEEYFHILELVNIKNIDISDSLYRAAFLLLEKITDGNKSPHIADYETYEALRHALSHGVCDYDSTTKKLRLIPKISSYITPKVIPEKKNNYEFVFDRGNTEHIEVVHEYLPKLLKELRAIIEQKAFIPQNTSEN